MLFRSSPGHLFYALQAPSLCVYTHIFKHIISHLTSVSHHNEWSSSRHLASALLALGIVLTQTLEDRHRDKSAAENWPLGSQFRERSVGSCNWQGLRKKVTAVRRLIDLFSRVCGSLSLSDYINKGGPGSVYTVRYHIVHTSHKHLCSNRLFLLLHSFGKRTNKQAGSLTHLPVCLSSTVARHFVDWTRTDVYHEIPINCISL